MKIEQRTFVVSGGSSGLGLATVRDLVARGAYVAILDLAPPPLDVLQDKTKFFKTDVAKTEEVACAVDGGAAWTKETGAALGGVVTAAGIGIPGKVIDASGSPLSLNLYKNTLDVNVTGSFDLIRLVCQHLVNVLPEGVDGERGVVVMVSSSAAYEGQEGSVAYAASKGAVRSMTLPLARDLARYGIRVNTIAPGVFDSNMTTSLSDKIRRSVERQTVFPRRFGRVEEFSETVRWIIECQFVNGETIRVSGAARLPWKL